MNVELFVLNFRRALSQFPIEAHSALSIELLKSQQFLRNGCRNVTSVAVLNEDRFLAPRGWSFADSVGSTNTLKRRFMRLAFSLQCFRWIIILFNIVCIAYKIYR